MLSENPKRIIFIGLVLSFSLLLSLWLLIKPASIINHLGSIKDIFKKESTEEVKSPFSSDELVVDEALQSQLEEEQKEKEKESQEYTEMFFPVMNYYRLVGNFEGFENNEEVSFPENSLLVLIDSIDAEVENIGASVLLPKVGFSGDISSLIKNCSWDNSFFIYDANETDDPESFADYEEGTSALENIKAGNIIGLSCSSQECKEILACVIFN